MAINYCTDKGGRITSEKVLIQYLPCGEENDHIAHLRFHPDVSGGTFKLWFNGEVTAAITFNSTIATLLTNINAALAALPNLGPTDLVATGTLVTNITLTAATDLGFMKIQIMDDELTGNTSVDPNVTYDVEVQGSKLLTLSGELSSFDYENSADTTSMTGMSEEYERQKSTLRKMTFTMNVYKSNAAWVYAVEDTSEGILYVYDEGKIPGRKYFAFWALFNKASASYPDHDKVEGEFAGVRNGPMVVPFFTTYNG